MNSFYDRNIVQHQVHEQSLFTDLYLRLKKPVYQYIWKMTNDKMLAEDLLQDVFIRCYQSFDRLSDTSAAVSYIFKAARNAVFMYYRSKSTHKDSFAVQDISVLELPDTETLESQYERNEVARLIQGYLNRVPEQLREIYLLKEYSGLSYQEIATVTGLEVSQVKSALFRIRQKLILYLEKMVK